MEKNALRLCTFLLAFLLFVAQTACQSIPETLSDETENSVENENRTLPEIATAYRADVEKIALEYEGKLNDYALKELTNEYKRSLTQEEYTVYDENPEKFLDEFVRFGFNYYLNFRIYGSVDAPIAPEDYDIACEMIREEFKDMLKNEEDRLIFEDILKHMEHNIVGAQSPTPYSDSPQLHFDATRNAIWGQFTDISVRTIGYPEP